MATLQATTVSGAAISSGHLRLGGSSPPVTGFQGYYAYWRNNIAYAVDFTVRQGPVGHCWWVSAAYSHSGAVSGTFGYMSEGWITRYSGVHHGIYQMHAAGNASVAGSISWSGPTLYSLRCTKNSGHYPGLGGCIIQVNGSV
jgi:hypothetical protein